jgi:hypothetical protein
MSLATAIHSVVHPTIASTKNITLTAIENQMFCLIMGRAQKRLGQRRRLWFGDRIAPSSPASSSVDKLTPC